MWPDQIKSGNKQPVRVASRKESAPPPLAREMGYLVSLSLPLSASLALPPAELIKTKSPSLNPNDFPNEPAGGPQSRKQTRPAGVKTISYLENCNF